MIKAKKFKALRSMTLESILAILGAVKSKGKVNTSGKMDKFIKVSG